MSFILHHPAARRAAQAMLARHANDAVAVAEREIGFRLAANDLDGALEMDQVRREVLVMLHD